MSWLMRTLFGVGVGLVLFSCVSRTFVDLRFAESAMLSPPGINSVTLSDPNNFTFAIVGDLHISHQNTDRLQLMLSQATAENDSFFVFLGDLVDGGVEADVIAFRTTLANAGWDTRSFPAIGNHDIFDGGWRYYKKYNGPSNYAFTIGNSKFIVLDTADGTVGNDQHQWLQNEIAKPRASNLFIVSHYLPTVPYEETYLKMADDVEALDLMKIATQYGVTAWLGGHYHSYLLGDVGGVNYVVAGGGGMARMPPISNYFFVQVKVAGSQVSYQLNKLN